MGFNVEVGQSPMRSGRAGEARIYTGELAVISGGEVHRADAETDEFFDGVVDQIRTGEYIPSFDHEAGNWYFTNDASELDTDNHAPLGTSDSDKEAGHLVPVGGGDDGNIIRARTIDDTTAAAPDIGDGDVVGFVDTSAADAPDSPGRLVQEGYENDGYGTADGFVAIGTAYRPSSDGDVTDHDALVRVRVNKGV